MAEFRTSRAFDLAFVTTIIAVIWLVAANRTFLADKLYFLHYQPTTKTQQIAAAAGFSDLGRTLFYRTDPTFGDRATIETQCDLERLGCLNPKGQTFILDDPQKPNQTIVTAAHEMLHLAYRRLSQNQKAELAPFIDQAIAQNATSGIEDELRPETTPEDRRDEAHSLLGTEYKNLPTELETYYSDYFSNRSKILTAATGQ